MSYTRRSAYRRRSAFLRGSALAFFCSLLVLSACSTDGPLDPSVRPDLPLAASLDADFSLFRERTPAAGGATASWSLALERIAAADGEITPILAGPAAVLRAAATATGTRSGNEWVWPFSVDLDGDVHAGELRSSLVGVEHGWNIVVDAPSRTPPLSDYHWVTGLAALSGASGRWWIADAANATDVLAGGVVWSLNEADDIDLAFSSSQTTVWTYERPADAVVVRRFVNNAEQWRVTWDPVAGSGSTWTAETDTSACWDADLHDVAC